jgi:YEATS domain-containing protein 4
VNPATGGFELDETAYGGFFINVKLYFQSWAGEKWQQRVTYLQLDPFDGGTPVKPGEETQSQRQVRENKIVSETVEFIEFNEPTDALWDALIADTQWDYLKPQPGQRGKGKGRASMGSADARAAGPLDISSLNATELPARGPEGQLWSKEAEDLIIAQLEKAGEEADKAFEKTMQRSKDLNNLLNTLKEGAAIDEKLKELFDTIPPKKK